MSFVYVHWQSVCTAYQMPGMDIYYPVYHTNHKWVSHKGTGIFSMNTFVYTTSKFDNDL